MLLEICNVKASLEDKQAFGPHIRGSVPRFHGVSSFEPMRRVESLVQFGSG